MIDKIPFAKRRFQASSLMNVGRDWSDGRPAGVWSLHVTFFCISVAKYNDWGEWGHRL